MKILFLVPHPLKESPSQRFRFEQYFDSLRTVSEIEVQSFLSKSNWQVFYKKRHYTAKTIALVSGYLKRCWTIVNCFQFQFIFIHREVAPLGPPVFEWIIARVFRKKIIYDFDDAIWLTDKTNEGFLEKLLKRRDKVASISKWAYRVSCGNEYLCTYARRFNQNVCLNPTTIDTISMHNPDLYTKEKNTSTIIGWTGSHSTLKYLQSVVPVIQRLENSFKNIQFLVIADKEPELDIRYKIFSKWSVNTEITDLLKIDIGIMPLPNDEWSKGKCGFKILQYMALSIPAIASPIGVNADIISPGSNGYLTSTQNEWYDTISQLILNTDLRRAIGNEGRKTVAARYSVKSNTKNFLSLFDIII